MLLIILLATEREWKQPSEVSALTAASAKKLLSTKKSQPTSATDKKHFKDALEIYLDEAKLKGWKEVATSELEVFAEEERQRESVTEVRSRCRSYLTDL